MNGKRLALAMLMVASIVAAVGGPSSSTGQTQDLPGVTYGGVKDQDPAWLRLDPGRRSIAALHIESAAAPERGSHRKAYASTLCAGYEWDTPIPVDGRGRFNKVIVNRYSYAGRRTSRGRSSAEPSRATSCRAPSAGGRRRRGQAVKSCAAPSGRSAGD
jgi:hypothetical protein